MRELAATHFFAGHVDQPALLIGNGPSANQILPYLDEIKHKFITIGMNRSWKLFHATYHAIMFHHEHLSDLAKRKYTVKTLWTYKTYAEKFTQDVYEGNVVYVASVADPNNPIHEFNLAGLISLDLSDCSYADMTGMFALEIALWMRCKPICLIGYDMYGGHFCDLARPEDDWQEVQAELFDMTARQIEQEAKWAKVYNCSLESNITGFEKIALEEAIGV